ncbi:transmembrane protein, putative [Medicago truncatula]|uniref:Transmembrane protein, putative n=1 Tax=Medicago truncatula TaxID=3880 RepID=G7IW42_MEDTR|nr:transmembrane protein, putative [Medicago truncatula]
MSLARSRWSHTSIVIRIHSSFLSETTLVETRKQHKRQNKDYQIQDSSDLSDDVPVHMLSFLNVKKAIQTCILSKRWTNLWKTLPTLALNFRQFRTNKVSNNSFLRFYLLAMTQPLFVLAGFNLFFPFRCNQRFPDSLNFPALTTLSLKSLAFYRNDDGFVDPFSEFNMLSTLSIDRCVLLANAQNHRISSTKPVNLTIQMYDCKPRFTNFGTAFGIELYAPTIHTFDFAGEKPSILFKWLVDLSNIESVTVTLRALKGYCLTTYCIGEPKKMQGCRKNTVRDTQVFSKYIGIKRVLKVSILRIYAHSLVVASEVLEEASKKIEELYYMEGIAYTSVLASLMCAMVSTCPDIAYAVSLVSRFTKNQLYF